jgi:hypothetical protein
LTDADVTALAVALEKRLEKKFYHDLGKGLWGLTLKAILGALIFIAAQHSTPWWKP